MDNNCCESCGGITLFKGKDGKTIYNGIGAPNIANPNNGDFYIDTESWEIYGPYNNGSWGAGTSIIGPIGIGISDIAWTSNSGGGAQGSPGTTDTYTVTLTDGSTYTFTVYNGANGESGESTNSDYGNTLFVDNVYGDNATGTREKFDLPYATITAALADAVSGDTIYVRPGTYSQSIVLKNGVNFYFENGSIQTASITDNGVDVISSIKGDLKLNASSNAINITGATSLTAELDSITCGSVPILIRPTGTKEANVEIVLNNIKGISANYCVTLFRKAYLTLNVRNSIQTLETTSPAIGLVLFDIRENYTGVFNIKCPYIFIGESTHVEAGILFNEENDCVDGGKIYLEIDKVVNNYKLASFNEKGIIDKNGASDAYLKIKTLKSLVRPIFRITGDQRGEFYSKQGTFVFEGNCYSFQDAVVLYRSTQRATFINSVLKRNSSGDNRSEVVLVGENIYYSVPGPSTGYRLKFDKCKIIKESVATEGSTSTGFIVKKVGTSPVYFSYCEVIGRFNITGGSFEAQTNNEFFIAHSRANLAVSGDFSNIATGAVDGTLIIDASLETFDDIIY